MTKRQYMILQYFLVRPIFFGLAYSKILGTSNNASPFSCLIGFILGLIACLFIFKINEIKKEQSIIEFLGNDLTGSIGKITLIIINTLLVLSIIISVLTIANSFYLLNTPVLVIGLIFISVIFHGLIKGTIPVLRGCEILFPISIFIFIFQISNYIFDIDINNLRPLFNTNLLNFIKSITIYFTYTVAPSLVLLNFKEKNYSKKYMLKGYIYGGLTTLLTITLMTLTIGFPLVGLFRYPEYIIMKRINILNFIANIENLLMIILIIDNIILGYFSTNLINDSIKSFFKNKFPITLFNAIFLISMVLVYTFIFYPNYQNILIVYNYEYYLLLGLILIFTIIIIIKLKRHYPKK